MSEPPHTAIRALIAARTTAEVRRTATAAADRLLDADVCTLSTARSEPTCADDSATDRRGPALDTPDAGSDRPVAAPDDRGAVAGLDGEVPGRRSADGERDARPAAYTDPCVIDDLDAGSRPDAGHVASDGRPYRSLLRAPVDDGRALLALARDPGAFDEDDLDAAVELAGYVEAALERTTAEDGDRDADDRTTEIANVLSHDVHNSLTIAEGHLQLARDGRDDEHLDRVDVAHDRIAELLDDVVALARTGSRVDSVEPVELAAAVERAWENVETGSTTLQVVDSPTVSADESSLRQLLENLFRNAVEHGSTNPRSQAREDAVEHGSTSPAPQAREDSGDRGFAASPEGGRPDVSVRVGALDDGIYVEDDGPGIPRERRDRVFASGHTTSADGTGFGLSIVRRIVDVHGWDIEVVDAASGGARFEITGVETGPVVAPVRGGP